METLGRCNLSPPPAGVVGRGDPEGPPPAVGVPGVVGTSAEGLGIIIPSRRSRLISEAPRTFVVCAPSSDTNSGAAINDVTKSQRKISVDSDDIA